MRALVLIAAALLLSAEQVAIAARTPARRGNKIRTTSTSDRHGMHLVRPAHSGYLAVTKEASLYYAYFEQQERGAEDEGPGPIVLWLQGGPGCASTFGMLYENGPWTIKPDGKLSRNPGAWNRKAGLLIIDQPIGTGLSFTHNKTLIPKDEMGMAEHLYTALQHFFYRYSDLQSRPLIVTGESYGGKYVPSIAHFILEAEQLRPYASSSSRYPLLKNHRSLPPHITPPLFKLAGIAVGNGLTSPRTQTLTLAETAWWAGLVSRASQERLKQQAEQVVGLIDSKSWEEAHRIREDLRTLITNMTGLATMFDTRRTEEYDKQQAVEAYLNNKDARDALRAKRKGEYASCSDDVRDAMSGDVMRSVAHLIPDLLQNIHVLLYQGQFDILDGPASNMAWIDELRDWPQLQEFVEQPSQLWCANDCEDVTDAETQKRETANISGWWRSAGLLTHAVVYRAGHMVPHDQPIAMQYLLETWMLKAMEGKPASA